MNKPTLKSFHYGRHPKSRWNHLDGDKIKYNNIENFIKVENSTFNFIKPLALLFFTLNAGVMAALFNTQPQQKSLILIFAVGIFISLVFLLISISRFIKSINILSLAEYEFIKIRMKAHWNLQVSIYFCLLTFEVALLVWGGEIFIYTVGNIINALYTI